MHFHLRHSLSIDLTSFSTVACSWWCSACYSLSARISSTFLSSQVAFKQTTEMFLRFSEPANTFRGSATRDRPPNLLLTRTRNNLSAEIRGSVGNFFILIESLEFRVNRPRVGGICLFCYDFLLDTKFAALQLNRRFCVADFCDSRCFIYFLFLHVALAFNRQIWSSIHLHTISAARKTNIGFEAPRARRTFLFRTFFFAIQLTTEKFCWKSFFHFVTAARENTFSPFCVSVIDKTFNIAFVVCGENSREASATCSCAFAFLTLVGEPWSERKAAQTSLSVDSFWDAHLPSTNGQRKCC